MSNFTPVTPELGIQPIALSSTVQNHPLGTIVRAYDASLGEGAFIYLAGVVSTVVGSLVNYDPLNGTGLTVSTGTYSGRAVAVAMSANVAAGFGWYQVQGVAEIKKDATIVNPTPQPLFMSATNGRVAATVLSGAQILNAQAANAASVVSATSTVRAMINYPCIQGQII